MTRTALRLLTWISILIMVLGSFTPGISAKSSWKHCSLSTDYKVSVTGVGVNPDPVVRGSNATFIIPALTNEPITGGTVVIEVYYHGVLVHTEKDDLCSKTTCPIVPGIFTFNNTERLPGFTPTGPYRLDMKVRGEDGALLTCVRINFRIDGSAVQLE